MIDDELTISKCSVDSVKMNSFMNSFAEMKRLEYGVKKCHKIHIGNDNNNCNDLKVHNEMGNKVDFDKYVGDILSSDGTNERKIRERCDRANGTINDIIAILDELPLGKYRIITGIRLREAMFLSRLLFNSESCYNLTEGDIKKLSALATYYFWQR